MKVGEAIKLLKKAGFILRNQKGSHMQFVRGNDRITIVYHAKDSEELNRSTEKNVKNLLNTK